MNLQLRIRVLFAEIETGWPANMAKAPTTPERLRTNVEEFCRTNRDGRGLRVKARRAVERTLKHIKSAERKAVGSGPLAHKARKLLKSLQHHKRFEVTIEKARGFAGEVQKAGRRRARRAAVCAGPSLFKENLNVLFLDVERGARYKMHYAVLTPAASGEAHSDIVKAKRGLVDVPFPTKIDGSLLAVIAEIEDRILSGVQR